MGPLIPGRAPLTLQTSPAALLSGAALSGGGQWLHHTAIVTPFPSRLTSQQAEARTLV